MYDIAMKISKKRNIPIVSYICDDYYFVKPEKSLMGKLKQRMLHKKIEALMKMSSRIITICTSLEDAYSQHFGTEAITVMTGSNYDVSSETRVKENISSLRYMGNIRCRRYNSLAEIGRALDEINRETGASYTLEIFTGEKNTEILGKFDGISSIKLCGYISGNEFDRTFFDSSMLLHTEAFDEDSIDLVKNSVSTKIADSLGSGIPFFAYGPDKVASMKHLIDNDCAIIVTDKEQLKSTLKKSFTDREYVIERAKKGLEIALIHHDRHVAGNKIRKIFEELK
jgi:hypothetical protein